MSEGSNNTLEKLDTLVSTLGRERMTTETDTASWADLTYDAYVQNPDWHSKRIFSRRRSGKYRLIARILAYEAQHRKFIKLVTKHDTTAIAEVNLAMQEFGLRGFWESRSIFVADNGCMIFLNRLGKHADFCLVDEPELLTEIGYRPIAAQVLEISTEGAKDEDKFESPPDLVAHLMTAGA